MGFATSFLYSPRTPTHIAIAQFVPELPAIRSEGEYEVTIDPGLQYVKAVVTKMPFYNPPHKTA